MVPWTAPQWCRCTKMVQGSQPEQPADGATAQAEDRVGRREAHRAHLRAGALPVAAEERVLAEDLRPALRLCRVARVELERERAVERGGPGEAPVVGHHRARRHAHAAADALDRAVDL